jgi:hypothetical protein
LENLNNRSWGKVTSPLSVVFQSPLVKDRAAAQVNVAILNMPPTLQVSQIKPFSPAVK